MICTTPKMIHQGFNSANLLFYILSKNVFVSLIIEIYLYKL